jgi:hypothetical protein
MATIGALLSVLPSLAHSAGDSVAQCLIRPKLPGADAILQALPNPCLGAPAPTADELALDLTPFFRAQTRELKRPMYFWHYGYRTPRFPAGAPPGEYDNSTPVPADGDPNAYEGPADPKRNAQEYFRKKVDAHLQAEDQESSWGSGLYSATDPLASIAFYKGALLRIGVPAGTRYLELRDHDDKRFPLSAELVRKALCEHGRRDHGDPAQWDAGTIENMTTWLASAINPADAGIKIHDLLELKPGRDALKRLYASFGTKFWVMQFGGHTFRECGARTPLKYGIQADFVQSDLGDAATYDLLVAELEPAPPPAKRRLYEDTIAFFEALDPVDCAREPPAEYPPVLCRQFGEKSAFHKLYRGWATRLYGLDPKISDQDLEAFRLRRHAAMTGEKRQRVVESDFACSPAFQDEARAGP